MGAIDGNIEHTAEDGGYITLDCSLTREIPFTLQFQSRDVVSKKYTTKKGRPLKSFMVAPWEAAPVDKEAAIAAYLAQHPEATLRAVATKFGVGKDKVSVIKARLSV
jgi:hypothetical protein